MKIDQLGGLLQARRKSLRLNQSDLADLAGLTVHTISNIESGKGNPTLKVLNRLLESLGLTMEVMAR